MVLIGDPAPDIVLADDHVVFVDAMATALERQGFVVRAVAFSAAQAVTVVRSTRPSVCLIDRHFADGDGVDVVGRILGASPGTKVVLLSADRDPDGVARAFAAGAAAYLHKSRTLAALINALGRILRDEVVTDLPAMAPRSAPWVDAHRLAEHLTDREWDCLKLLVDGLDTAKMAARLGVSRATVRTHVQASLTKLGVHSRLEAASFAVRHRLLDDGSDRARAI
ncbi:MAG TPA: response regulator transcription factor [Pseudonocardiaceae bacterium]|jgi:DNA-binding NarL/FixJ family response regulator